VVVYKKGTMSTPQSILKTTFGYDTFRPLQHEVIENVLARRDTLAIMPTGGGKSLCYQIPSLVFEGLTVVVSPLISLMKDQVEQLRALGVPALFLNSSLSPLEYQENMDYVRRGEVKLLYLAPETLLIPRILSLLSTIQVDLFTIDEAHCISEWGHDFRPEYRQLVEVRQKFPKAACLALTATATPRVRTDIRSTLKFSTTNEFVASFNRENLYIEVTPKRDAIQQTIKFLNRFKDQSGIIYCFSRKQVDELTAYLTSQGYSVRPYHAGLEDAERRRNQEAFIRDDVQIIVATIAFGMGINKPNVRFIIHYDLPKSIEGYYQEIGRSGRDGLPAHCLLLYSYADVAKLNYFIEQKDGEERRVAMQHLNAIVKYAEDEFNCRRKPLLTYFGESFPADNCSNCDNCTSAPAALTDITIPAQKLLSCVKRTGEKFGAVHIADVLLGSMNEKVVKFRHDKVSTHGIGKELNQKQWTRLARQLTQLGYLDQDGEYRSLSLTQKALDALRNREKIYGVIEEVRERTKKQGKRKEELEYNKALFALLRAKRKDMADEVGVPPYVIFSDKTLAEMAAYYPQSVASMLTISGVGQVKARQYGEAFLEVIQRYCEQHKIAEKKKESVRDKSDSNRRYFLVGEAFNAGEGIESLRERYQVSLGTIVDHLTRYAAAGNKLRNSDEFQVYTSTSKEKQEAAFAAFNELGADFLKPVFDKLNGALNYDQLKILRIIYLCQK
jgi:ATP-dependent DNA helicase RecQ